MPSPFPGMNPYLEEDDVWHDFHGRFLPAAAEELTAQLVPDDIVKIDEHVYVHEPRGGPGRARRAGPATAAEPGPGGSPMSIVLDLPDADEVERQSFVTIRTGANRELVTVVELLSPSIKQSGWPRSSYAEEQHRLSKRSVHFVQIDLLRGGLPMLVSKGRRASADTVLVCRSEERPIAGFWPIGLRDPLPKIPVPVRAPDRDAALDLQRLLHRIYDAAGYHYYIYDGRPDPPLGPEDAAWAESLIPGREPNPPHEPDRP